VSIVALERITTALEWDPFELPLREQDTLPEGIRTLLLVELTPHAAPCADSHKLGADPGRGDGAKGHQSSTATRAIGRRAGGPDCRPQASARQVQACWKSERRRRLIGMKASGANRGDGEGR
jgi:hypothetical protein